MQIVKLIVIVSAATMVQIFKTEPQYDFFPSNFMTYEPLANMHPIKSVQNEKLMNPTFHFNSQPEDRVQPELSPPDHIFSNLYYDQLETR